MTDQQHTIVVLAAFIAGWTAVAILITDWLWARHHNRHPPDTPPTTRSTYRTVSIPGHNLTIDHPDPHTWTGNCQCDQWATVTPNLEQLLTLHDRHLTTPP